MTESVSLFGSDAINGSINRIVRRLDTLETLGAFELQRNSHLRRMLISMRNDPSGWNKCQINIGWIGSHFEGLLVNAAESPTAEGLDDIFITAFRFLYELYLTARDDLSHEYRAILSFVEDHIDSFGEKNKSQAVFVMRDLPVALFKELANSEAIGDIRDYISISKKSAAQVEGWSKDLSEKEARVTVLKDALDRYETAFNFVGLYQGFNDMAEKKKEELGGLRRWLIFFGALSLIPLILELAFIYMNFEGIEAIHMALLYAALPTISMMVLLIYFFRVLLHNYKSIKSQLLQIDLRRALCRFIQDYADYSSKIKEKNSDSLSRFEAIVFSSIVSDEDKLPSTYDGLEQIGKIIKSIK